MIAIKKYILLLFPVSLLTIITLLVFGNLFRVFFQQDEWHNFGYIILNDYNFLNVLKDNWVNFLQWASIPLSMFFNFSFFKLAGLNTFYYALLSIILHIVNAYLVFVLASQFFKRKSISFVAALFFLLNSTSSQAVIWFGNISSSEPVVFFVLLSLILFIKYLNENKRKFYYWSIILFIISLGFKESSFFLFLFLPLFDYIWRKKEDKKILPFLKSHLILLGSGFVFFLLRFIPIFSSETKGLFLGGGSKGFIPTMIYNFIFYPLKALSQIFVYPDLIINNWAQKLTELKYPELVGNLSIQETIISEYIIVLFSIIILLFLFRFHKYTLKKETDKKLFFVSILFIFLSVLPYIILKQGAYLESRYYYLISIGGALLFGLVVLGIADFVMLKLKTPFLKVSAFYFVILVIAIPYFYAQASFIKKDINQIAEISTTRKSILHQIINTYREIDKKTIFYTESNQSYYGQKENIMPFQSGFGQTLMVLYAHDKQLNPKFFENNFLWDLLNQGYKEVGDSGFGYFRNYSEILQVIETNNLSHKNIYAFKWDGERKTLKDTTAKVRRKAWLDLARNIEISNKSEWRVSATDSLPHTQSSFLVDDDFKTVWATEEAYRSDQFILIDLGDKVENIISIKQYVTENLIKDGIFLGFKIETSLDRKNWQVVFEENPYPPDRNGEINISFEPVSARYLKITQLGNHSIALWSLKEIDVYKIDGFYE